MSLFYGKLFSPRLSFSSQALKALEARIAALEGKKPEQVAKVICNRLYALLVNSNNFYLQRSEQTQEAPKQEAPKQAADDDNFDLFGSEDEASRCKFNNHPQPNRWQ